MRDVEASRARVDRVRLREFGKVVVSVRRKSILVVVGGIGRRGSTLIEAVREVVGSIVVIETIRIRVKTIVKKEEGGKAKIKREVV